MGAYAASKGLNFAQPRLRQTSSRKRCKQETLVKSLVDFTSCSRSEAIALLKKHAWSVSTAADKYFEENANIANLTIVNEATIAAWFDTYAGKRFGLPSLEQRDVDYDDPDCMLDDGILKFCDDIGIDAQDIVVLVIAWKMQAAAMCTFTKKEFVRGMKEMGCESASQLSAKLPGLRALLADPSSFKPFYSFCFLYSKDQGQKSLGKEMAIAMWELVLAERFPKTKDWIAFLETHNSHGVTRDTWDLFFDFMLKVETSYDAYDENEAWPVLIDDFMTHIEAQKK
ncbi:hypothetical protein SPRG_05966 [Saprolegnia parasitica CBS 223.65]|uniref:Defective in cullin neddylation protein n=1 Tax=Saprolegnia parasitica (strain CBS 223.65) TaxID=695850 RepID=A0A067CFZ2_SAPPC|nr:hypothetical protein SPRG_05966 [Saprolegnia parasitica CBS 223.65]KDO29428.1 hypothetical protein SPRG_05966 [Saprolegnia parasitica CBS 223.65]|eukprot:XP_012199929.1 hypothetical protein SPRG_05966 [Saprolegnia parasitica CBS 223.65]